MKKFQKNTCEIGKLLPSEEFSELTFYLGNFSFLHSKEDEERHKKMGKIKKRLGTSCKESLFAKVGCNLHRCRDLEVNFSAVAVCSKLSVIE